MPVYLGTQRIAVRGGTQAGQGGGSTPKLEGTKYVTPDKNSQTVTYGSGYDGLSKVVVYPIPDSYIKPASTLSTKTWTPGSENQTIAAGTYLTGAQTIKGDSNLIADNIKSGVKIFDVTGSYVGNVSSGDGNGIIPTYTQTTKEWTPTISDQFIEAGTYCEGRQVIKGDANLKAENIKDGVEIFGVTGNYLTLGPVIFLPKEGSAEHLLSGKQLLDTDFEIVEGTMPNRGQITKTISTKTENYTIPEGYHNGNGNVSIDIAEQEKIIASNIKEGVTILGVTGNYSVPDNAIVPTKTLGTTTYIPTTAEIRIAAGTYCEGDQIIPGDPDLKAENIKSGVTIFNIAGSYTGPEGNVVPTTKLQYKEWTPKAANQTIEAGTYCEGQQVIKGDANLVASKIKSGETIFGVTGSYEGPSGYVIPTSKKAADTYTPNTKNQTIAAGTYLEGDQTILGDANLIPENIKSGITIFNVIGSYAGSGGATVKTAETTPSSNGTSISFTVSKQPTIFSVMALENITSATTRKIVNIDYDGSTIKSQTAYSTSSYSAGTIYYYDSAISQSYSNGTLTLTSSSTSTGGYFASGITYRLLYITDEVSSGGSSSSGGVNVNKATAEQVTISGSYGSSISIEYSQNEPVPVVNANGTSITLGFTNSTEISRVSASTDLSVLSNTYAIINSGTYGTTTSTCYYIPQSSTCTFEGGSGITSTSKLTITSAQKVTMSLS